MPLRSSTPPISGGANCATAVTRNQGCIFHALCCPERQRARSTRRQPALLTTASCTSPLRNAKGNALPLVALHVHMPKACNTQNKGEAGNWTLFGLGSSLSESAWGCLAATLARVSIALLMPSRVAKGLTPYLLPSIVACPRTLTCLPRRVGDSAFSLSPCPWHCCGRWWSPPVSTGKVGGVPIMGSMSLVFHSTSLACRVRVPVCRHWHCYPFSAQGSAILNK